MGVITLNRQRGRPVSFNGEILAESSTREDSGDNKYRWWNVKVCRNDDMNGQLRVGIGRLTQFSDTERDHYWMEDADSLDDVFEIIIRRVNTFDDSEVLIKDLETKLNNTGQTQAQK